MDSNQLNSNRLGVRGTEDLGGGLLAGFWLEGGMDNSTGQAGAAGTGLDFQRRSTVSLTTKAGEIRFGRDYVVSFSQVASFDAYGANGFANYSNLYASGQRKLASAGTPVSGAFNAGLNSGATTAVRANNMVGYFLPSGLGGIYGGAQLAAGEGVKGNKYAGGRLGYAAGPFDISAAYSETSALGANKYKTFGLGGSYDLGVAKLSAQMDQRKFGTLKYTSYQVSGSVPLGQGEFRASYAKGNASGTVGTGVAAVNTDNNDATLIGAEYIYNLSKRTALYTQVGRLSNKGNSNLTVGGVTADADITAGGFRSTAYGFGVRHSF